MATFTITNNLSATEPVIPNAGDKTGPKKSVYKFNTIEVPLPRTNLKVALAPTESVALTTTDLVEVEFYDVMKDNNTIPGLGIVKS